MEVLRGKSSIIGTCSIAMFHYRRILSRMVNHDVGSLTDRLTIDLDLLHYG